MRALRRHGLLLFLIISFLIALEGGVLSQIGSKYEYKDRGDRMEGRKGGSDIAGEKLQLVSALVQYHVSSLLRVEDLTDPTNLALKLRKAEDPISKYLHGEFSTSTQELLDEYDGSSPPSEAFRKALVGELNLLLKGPSLYDSQRFTQIKLTGKIQRLMKQNLQEEDLIRLNRLLLEVVYLQEIARIQDQSGIPPDYIKKLTMGFFLNESKSNVNVTVAERRQWRYFMTPFRTEYQAGFNEFSWDASIVRDLEIDLRSLDATVEVKRNPNIIAPVIIYYDPLPKRLKLRAYRFVFVPNSDGDVSYRIENGAEIDQGTLKGQLADQPTFVTWECGDAGEGWYKLRMTFSTQDLHTDYEFYHKPVLDIPEP